MPRDYLGSELVLPSPAAFPRISPAAVRRAPDRGAGRPAPDIAFASAAASAGRLRMLPAVEPGQLWLVESRPGRGFSTAERHLLGSANVILYDRALAAEVAAILPLGGYAEPAPPPPPAETPDCAVIDRCARFALDGWSVARLVDAGPGGPGRAARLDAVSARLRAAGAGAELPVRLFGDAGSGAYTEAEISLGAFDPAAAGIRAERLIVVFGAVAAGTAPPPCAVAANGLAG